MKSEIMGVFGLFWFFFGIVTYGASIPSGVFLSAILVGLSVGQIYENIRINTLGIETTIITSLPLILGATCMISSYTRMSYSVVVLMLEATNSFNLVIPIIIAVFITRTVADLFTHSIFMYEVREK